MTKGRTRSRPKVGRKIVARGTPARWGVGWHPKALDEKNAIEDVAERVAIAHVIEKLEVDARSCRARTRAASWARRARACESCDPTRQEPVAALYRRADETLFAILAIGPEAEITAVRSA
jgi:hypothetical protein